MACNMIPVCEFCGDKFSESVIPLVLKCNHTFCKHCISQLSQMDLPCTKCQRHIDKRINDLPVNTSLLLVPRSNSVKDYDPKSKDIPLHIAKLYSSLLRQSEDSSQNIEETEDSNVRIHESESKTKVNDGEDNNQAEDGLSSSDSGQTGSITHPLLNIEESHGFFQSIYNHVKSGENVYACGLISNERRYGKLSIHEDSILFHCLDLSSIPENSSIIKFSRIKENLRQRKFHAFIKVSSQEAPSGLVIIELLSNNKKGLTNHFIHYCTGEDGQSYKNFVQVSISNKDGGCCALNDCVNLLHVIPEPGIPIYNRDIEGDYEDGMLLNRVPIVPNDTVFVEHFYMKGWFSLVSLVANPEEKDYIGRVINPVNLFGLLYYDGIPKVKIIDSGLSVRI